VKRLEKLFLEEKIFIDYELNINTLAKKLENSRNKFLQFFNENFGLSFSTYISSLYVKEVQAVYFNLYFLCDFVKEIN
jgi:YesN/AraC family two-component response regulator